MVDRGQNGEIILMASITIHGGDFIAGRGKFKSGVLTLPTSERPYGEKIPLSKVMRVEAVNKEMKHRTGAAVGRGFLAGIVAGPIGAVGAVLGGPTGVAVGLASAVVGFTTTNHTSDVTFEAGLEGGRRLLATTNTATFTSLLGAAFDYKPPSPIERGAKVRSVLATEVKESFWQREIPGPKAALILAACVVVPGLLFASAHSDHSDHQAEAREPATGHWVEGRWQVNVRPSSEQSGMGQAAWQNLQREAAQSHQNAVDAHDYARLMQERVQDLRRDCVRRFGGGC